MAAISNKIWALGSVLSLSVDELVVQDRGGKFMFRTIFSLVLHSDNAALAKDFAVLLSGDLLWHFKDHLDQCVFGEALGASQQHARLAQVLNNPFAPGAQILDPVTYRGIESNSARAGHPGGFAHMLPTLWRCGFSRIGLDPLGTAHRGPVILVFGSTKQADLVELPVRGSSWPGKLVGATT